MTGSQVETRKEQMSPELEELHQLLDRVFCVTDKPAVNLVLAASLPVDPRVRPCPLLCVETDWSKWQTQWIEAVYIGMEGIERRAVWSADELRRMGLAAGLETMDGLLAERAKRVNQQVLIVDPAWRLPERVRKRSRWWEFSQHVIRVRTEAPRAHPVHPRYWTELRQAADRVRGLNLRPVSSTSYRMPDWLMNYLQALVNVNPHLKRWEVAYNNLAGMVQAHAELFDRVPGRPDWFAGFRLIRDSIPYQDAELLGKLKAYNNLKQVCRTTAQNPQAVRRRLNQFESNRILERRVESERAGKMWWRLWDRDAIDLVDNEPRRLWKIEQARSAV